MLTRLLVNNLTVIEKAEMEFEQGLTIISGETGAGKTMLTQAIRLVSGEKTNTNYVGPNDNEAYVEAEFYSKTPEIIEDLVGNEETIVLARRIKKDGPARALVCGRSANTEQLQKSSEQLISLTGQHAARQITKPAQQLLMLDQKAGNEKELLEIAGLWKQIKNKENDLSKFQKQMLDSQEKAKRLKDDIEYIESIEPLENEEEQLEQELKILQHSVLLRQTTEEINNKLVENDNSIIDILASLQTKIEEIKEFDVSLEECNNIMFNCIEQLNDVARHFRSLNYETNNDKLQEIETRLSEIYNLRRRYHNLQIKEILEHCQKCKEELENITHSDEYIQTIQKEIDELKKQYDQIAEKLTNKRKQSAKETTKLVKEHLEDLALPNAEFIIKFSDDRKTITGKDQVQFLLSVNPGLEPAPLDQGASGGELSRVNLALLLAISSKSGTYIFDEVDTGIGGEVAHQVASKLKNLSKTSQVIVITHLAQIAIAADKHYMVQKNLGRTQIKELDEQEKTNEIARLVGITEGQDAHQLQNMLLESAKKAEKK